MPRLRKMQKSFMPGSVIECGFVIGAERVSTGKFGAMMDVKLVNNGPVTVMLESKEPQHT